MLARSFLLVALFFSLNCSQIALGLSDNTKVKLKELLQSSPEISNSVPSPFVNKEIAGQRIRINNENYEVRYFSFEDTAKILQENTTFKEYATKNNLLEQESMEANPLANINFQCFDFRFASLNDGIYFSMAIRKIDN